MRDIRGTLILADHVYQDRRSLKWIISGTYNHWQTEKDLLHLPDFQFYIRLQVEQPGRYACRLTGIDRMQPPQQPPIWNMDFEVDIPTEQIPVFQMGLTVPSPTVRAVVPYAKREPGRAYALRNLIMLSVADQDVASCPLDFIFLGPSPG